MDFNVPNHFVDLRNKKNTAFDFEREANKLQQVLDAAKKESDIQQYINTLESGLFLVHYYWTTILDTTQHIWFPNKLWAQNIVLIICC